MTAILTEIRDLDARRGRGELSPSEYASLRANLLRNIEDAETQFVDTSHVPQKVSGKTWSSAIGFSVVVCLGVMGLCVSLTLLFLPDLNLAITLGVTILAALSVALMLETGE